MRYCQALVPNPQIQIQGTGAATQNYMGHPITLLSPHKSSRYLPFMKMARLTTCPENIIPVRMAPGASRQKL